MVLHIFFRQCLEGRTVVAFVGFAFVMSVQEMLHVRVLPGQGFLTNRAPVALRVVAVQRAPLLGAVLSHVSDQLLFSVVHFLAKRTFIGQC